MPTYQFGRRSAAALITALLALVLSGCGTSVDPALVESAGKHGDVLEVNYVLLASDVLEDASTRDLKDVNAALKAGDPKKATPGDLRRAQGEISDRIDGLAKYRKKLAAAQAKLRRTPLPDWNKYLDVNDSVEAFSDDYATTTETISNTGKVTLSATTLATVALERYLDFLEQWEQYVTSDDTSGFESSAEASDAALAKLNRKKQSLKRQADVSDKLQRLASQMASAASEDSQLSALVDDLKESYPKSYLSVHLVEKK